MENKKMGLTAEKFSYCPGCLHGVVHQLVAEVLEEMDEVDNTIGVAPVGCAVLAYKFFNCDMQEAAHGRACAVATGIKRVRPQNTVFTYQGDGDLASIGIAETIHAANRGENITVIFVNNANFGMTGGQMSPCTLLHQKTTTSPDGRDPQLHGNPIKVSEMISQLDGPILVARTSVTNPKNVLQTKNLIKKAFTYQKTHKGFSFVEVLSTCPINWGKKPLDAIK
jgi:2-oxoglutarate ferredoxin oxidoreductase subunit beta